MPAAVGALEEGAGRADKAVALGIALVVPAAIIAVAAVVIGVGIAGAERRGRNRASRVDRACGDGPGGADRAADDVARSGRGLGAIGRAIAIAMMPHPGIRPHLGP